MNARLFRRCVWSICSFFCLGFVHLDAAVGIDSFPCIDVAPEDAPDEDFQIIKRYTKTLNGIVHDCALISRIQYCKDGKFVGEDGYSGKPVEVCVPIEIV
jgi:hypothetical protein